MPDEEKLELGNGAAFVKSPLSLQIEQDACLMGDISKRLHERLKKTAKRLKLPTVSMRSRADMPSIPRFIEEGLDPVHAVYAFLQNITSFFGEAVSELPELKLWVKVAGDAEEKYLPSGPPMSPLTGSFFTTWAFYDLKIGGSSDTMGRCLIDANDVIMMNPHQVAALEKLCDSRMGIYEHIGMDGPHVRLRELITGDELACLSTSGYSGRKGELWYVRILPPLEPELASYHIVFTTPYVLIQSSRDDWTQFLERTLVKAPGKDERERLHSLLKDGLKPNSWNEFVFQAYHHHQHDAIFLAGIPDLRDTLPHA